MLNFLTVLKNDTRYLKMYFLVLNKVQGASFIVLGSIVMSLEVGDIQLFPGLRAVCFKVLWQLFIVVCFSPCLISAFLFVLSGSCFPSNALVLPYPEEAGLLKLCKEQKGQKEYRCRALVWLPGFCFLFFFFYVFL